jgi:hypothetical protein
MYRYLHTSTLLPLLLLLTAKLSNCEICNLCVDGNEPSDPNAKFTYTKNNQFYTVPCSQGYELALQGEFSSCTALQSNVKDICGCDVDEESCNLCFNEEMLPVPNRRVAGHTCEYWELKAQQDFAMDCPTWQKSIGTLRNCVFFYES